nr:hypothetical protein [Tanacetum cinerariifolium]
MSDSKDSRITYTDISSPFKHPSNIGSLGVDGLPMVPQDPYVQAALQAPPSPDHVLGPKHPPSPVYVPEFVPEPSPGYIDESDPDDDPEEDPVDHPADGGDEGDDEDESSDDDEVDDVYIEGDEEEGENLAAIDSIAIALPAVDHALSAEETGPFETDESAATPPPHPAYRVTTRMSIRPQTSISLPSDAEIARLMAIPTPPPSPLSTLSSPLSLILLPLPQILSPLLPPSLPLPTSPTYLLGYRATMIRLRAEVPSTSYLLLLPSTYHLTPPSGTPPLLPIPLPTPSPPLLPPSIDHRADVCEVCIPPRKRLCYAPGSRFEVGENSSAPTVRPAGDSRLYYGFIATLDDEILRDPKRDVRYGITDSWDEIVETMQGALATDETELGTAYSGGSTAFRDCGVVGGISQEIGIVHRGTKTADETSDLDDGV